MRILNVDNMSKNAIVILSHHMDANGNLGKQTLARVDLAVRLFEQENFDFIITSGWDYRDDSNLKIGNVVAEKLSSSYPIEKKNILVDINARDTVGDAYFLRKNIVSPFNIKTLTVVTSDYHVKRTDHIFKIFYSPAVRVTTVGAELNLGNQAELLLHEEMSSKAFDKTFSGIDISSDFEVCKALSQKHPFYNGDIYNKYECDSPYPANFKPLTTPDARFR